MDEPGSAELPLDFPFLLLPFALGGAPEDMGAELPDPAFDEVPVSEEGAVPVSIRREWRARTVK